MNGAIIVRLLGSANIVRSAGSARTVRSCRSLSGGSAPDTCPWGNAGSDGAGGGGAGGGGACGNDGAAVPGEGSMIIVPAKGFAGGGPRGGPAGGAPGGSVTTGIMIVPKFTGAAIAGLFGGATDVLALKGPLSPP